MMRREENTIVVICNLGALAPRKFRMFAGELDLGDMRVVVANNGAFVLKFFHEHVTGGLAVVIDVRFVRHAAEEDI